MRRTVPLVGPRLEPDQVVAGALARDPRERTAIGRRQPQQHAARHAGQTLDPRELVVGAAEPARRRIDERVLRGIDHEVVWLDHVDVRAREARRAPDLVVVNRAELARARRAGHRRVAPRQHHARRHEDDRFRSLDVRETGKVIRERVERVARAAPLVRIGRLLRRLTRDRRENLQHALVISRRLDEDAAVGHGHEPDPVARRQARRRTRRPRRWPAARRWRGSSRFRE